MNKTCSICGAKKPTSDFYAHPNASGGRMALCKECHKARVRENRAANLERYREFDRKRASLLHNVKARKEYAELTKATPYLRAMANARSRAWMERNAEKRAAHVKVGNALRDGRLLKAACERCGDKRTDAHHDDYGKPLDVR